MDGNAHRTEPGVEGTQAQNLSSRLHAEPLLSLNETPQHTHVSDIDAYPDHINNLVEGTTYGISDSIPADDLQHKSGLDQFFNFDAASLQVGQDSGTSPQLEPSTSDYGIFNTTFATDPLFESSFDQSMDFDDAFFGIGEDSSTPTQPGSSVAQSLGQNASGLNPPAIASSAITWMPGPPLNPSGPTGSVAPNRYSCNNCPKTFTRQADQNRHARKHNPHARRFPCPEPTCRFSGMNGMLRKDKLKEHRERLGH